MKHIFCFLGIILSIMLISDQLVAQVRYLIVGAEDSVAVIETPLDIQIKIGDKFYITRFKKLRELAIAIAKVDRINPKYIRVKVIETIINTQPRKGDYLVPYEPPNLDENKYILRKFKTSL